ncbi:MAG: CoB--CoM heterodisulfide reductase subunit C [Promethearchaeota archaeon]
MENISRKRINKISSEISDKIVADDLELIRSCFQCGTCTGSCPSGRRTALRTRAVIRKALIGLDEVLNDPDIWLCSTCYTCFERCPRAVPVTDIIIKLRNLATQKGKILAPHKALTHILIDTGHGVPINDKKWNDLRESYDLNPVPPTTHAHPDAVKEIQTLVKSLKFDKLVDYMPPGKEKKKAVKKKPKPTRKGRKAKAKK